MRDDGAAFCIWSSLAIIIIKLAQNEMGEVVVVPYNNYLLPTAEFRSVRAIKGR